MPERGSKRQRCQSSEKILEFFRRDPNDFLLQQVTMDEPGDKVTINGVAA